MVTARWGGMLTHMKNESLTEAAKLMGSARSERKHAACIESLKKARAAQARKRLESAAWQQARAACEGTIHRPNGVVRASEKHYDPIMAPFPKHSYLMAYQWVNAMGNTGLSRLDLLTIIKLNQDPWNAPQQMRQILYECRKRGLIVEEDGD